MKRLQFGTKKCIKLHVGKSCNKTLWTYLFVDGWNIEVVEDITTGQVSQKESFGGQEKMEEKQE